MCVREPPQPLAMSNERALCMHIRITELKTHMATFIYLYLFRHKNKTHRKMGANDYTKLCTCLRYPNENFCLLILFTCAVKIYSRAPNAYIPVQQFPNVRSPHSIFIAISFRSLKIVHCVWKSKKFQLLKILRILFRFALMRFIKRNCDSILP